MIRQFHINDLDKIMEIWLETNIISHDFIDENYWKNNFKLVKDMMPSSTIYVCELNNKVVGFIGIIDSYIAGIFVENAFQSKGIGKQLLDCAKNKNSHLTLSVYAKNIKAINFYNREDFYKTSQKTDETTNELEITMVWQHCPM